MPSMCFLQAATSMNYQTENAFKLLAGYFCHSGVSWELGVNTSVEAGDSNTGHTHSVLHIVR